MLSILCVRLTIKVKVGIPESFKVGWYPPKKTGSSHLKAREIEFEEFEDFGKQSKVLADLSFPLVLFLTVIFSHEELC